MDFEEWARYGWEQGWCGPPVCCVCDGVPVSDAEVSDERCVHIIRARRISNLAGSSSSSSSNADMRW